MNNKIVFILILLLTTCSAYAKGNLASVYSKLEVGDTLVWNVPIKNNNFHVCWSSRFDQGYDAKSNELSIYLTKGATAEQFKLNLSTDFCEVIKTDKMTALPGVTTQESLALLEMFIPKSNRQEDEEEASRLIHAIALHKDPAAFDALVTFSKNSATKEQKEHINLMATTLWEKQGYEFVIRQASKTTDADAMKNLIFVVSQSPIAEARTWLKKQMLKAASKENQKEAIFWYAQTADKHNAADTVDELMSLLKTESSQAMQEHIIFSLAQIEDGKGLESLVKLIRTSNEPNIQQKALFWLAHSDEDKAMPILEELLGTGH